MLIFVILTKIGTQIRSADAVVQSIGMLCYPRIAAAVVVLMVAASCSTDAEPQGARLAGTEAPATTAPVVEPDVDSLAAASDVNFDELTFVHPDVEGLTIDDLRSSADRTLDVDTLRFRLVADNDAPNLGRRTLLQEITFNREAGSGRGVTVYGDDSRTAEAWAEVARRDGRQFDKPFAEAGNGREEFVLVDDVMWNQRTSQGYPTAWVGFDVNLFGDLFGGDPEYAVDGGIYLLTLMVGVLDTPGVAVFGDRSQVWRVELNLDVVAPMADQKSWSLVTLAGFTGGTGLSGTGYLVVGASGRLLAAELDLSAWWSEASVQTGSGSTDASVSVLMLWQAMSEPFDLAAPCDNAEVVDARGFDFLACPDDT